MKSRNFTLIITIFLFLFLNVSIHSQEQRESEDLQESITFQASLGDCLVATAEIFYINATVRGFCTMVLCQSWLPVNMDTIRYSLTNPWLWDNSRFLKNQIAHPYFGSMYYTAARANNMGFLASSLLTAFGSFTWETCMEAGNNSMNDFITTSLAGIVLGETLFRLGSLTSQKWAPLEWIVNPIGSATNLIRNSRPQEPLGDIQFVEIRSGLGYTSSRTSFVSPEGTALPWQDETWDTPQFFLGTTIMYGDPYGHQTRQLFDQFFVDIDMDLSSHYRASAEVEGMLYSLALGNRGDNPHQNHKADTTLGTTLRYAIDYGKDMLLSQSTAGIIFDQRYMIPTENSSMLLSYKANLDWNFLSAKSNWFLLHDDTRLECGSPSQPDYIYCYGPQARLSAQLVILSMGGTLMADGNAQLLLPYRGSARDPSLESSSLTLGANISYSQKLVQELYATLEGSFSKEIPLSHSVPAASELNWGIKAYLEWFFY